MEASHGCADLDVCKNQLVKPGISVVDAICPSSLAREIVMGPVTPFSDRENPAASSPSDQSEEADPGSACQTPKESTFDPFAPGPERLVLAPKKKVLKKTCVPIRQPPLDLVSCFDSGECVMGNIQEALVEESFLETAYRSLLDVILPPGASLSQEIEVSDASGAEGKTGIRREDTKGKEDMEDMDPCHGYLSEDGGSGLDGICPSNTVNGMDLGPLTPFSERENLDISSPSDRRDDGDLGSDCQTPRERTFDSFAPGPERLMFAPKKKSVKETHVSVQRMLNFDSCSHLKENLLGNISEGNSEEKSILVSVYKSLLDVIISCQVGELNGESLSADSTLFDGSKTPTSLPLLNGVAETCPGAPLRPTSKTRKFSVNICRKLEF
uniref:Uncharacterized protein n=1 Tax=Anthurium amnicola TaxID=1678845 RepID=A0A1D1XS67_9ARAE